MNSSNRLFKVQFRLWASFVIITPLVLFPAWLAWKYVQVRAERPATAWIESLGGQVRTDSIIANYDSKTAAITIVYAPDASWNPDWVAQLVGTPVKTVEIKNGLVTDVSHLAALTDLEFIQLEDMQHLDLAPIAGLERLKVLMVRNASIGELSPLMKLDNLEIICFDNTRVDRQQVKALRKALPHTAICRFGRTW